MEIFWDLKKADRIQAAWSASNPNLPGTALKTWNMFW
jgi:hypothetical protein